MKDRLCVLVRELGKIEKDKMKRQEAARSAVLRLDLTDEAYADWFLKDKIIRGSLRPSQFQNDFVLFRIVYDWPKGAKWGLDSEDIQNADFSLTSGMAKDLVDFAAEGLTDGYEPADWYLRVAAAWYASHSKKMPQPLLDYLQRALFLAKQSARGRKRKDSLDRDIVIRKAFDGLKLRGCGATRAQTIIATSLNMTPDAVRKVIGRTHSTEREKKYWDALKKNGE
jgi:hypothetical protein